MTTSTVVQDTAACPEKTDTAYYEQYAKEVGAMDGMNQYVQGMQDGVADAEQGFGNICLLSFMPGAFVEGYRHMQKVYGDRGGL